MRNKYEHKNNFYHIVRVDQEDVEEVWPTIRDSVCKAMTHSDCAMEGDDFRDELIKGNCQLWLLVKDAKEVVGHVITQITQYPRKRILRVLTFESKGGESGMLAMKLWYEFYKDIEDFGKKRGCDHVEAQTRAGMARTLKKYGWNDQYHIVTKEINYGG